MLRAALAAVLLAAAQPAVAACPEWLVSDMEASAVPAFEISRLCGEAPSRGIGSPAAAPASVPPPAPAAAAPAPPAVAAPPVAAQPAMPGSLAAPQRGLGLFGLQGQTVRPRIVGSSRCVPETGPACATPTPRPLGSPCWCADKAGPREGTIR